MPSSNEVFANPTVKQVIFQIRFPSLFYMENRIGDFQLRVAPEFPDAKIIHKHQFLIAQMPVKGGQAPEVPSELGEPGATRIWQFSSSKGYDLNVTTETLSISSEHHKTYNSEGRDKFRDVIEMVLDHFFEFAPLPTVSRIGLRYIDHCPIPAVTNDAFRAYYDTVLPLDRFALDTAVEMISRATVKRGSRFLRYIESLRLPSDDDGGEYIMDFDAYANDVQSDECLAETDALHDLVSTEYLGTIKEPVKEHMRRAEQQ